MSPASLSLLETPADQACQVLQVFVGTGEGESKNGTCLRMMRWVCFQPQIPTPATAANKAAIAKSVRLGTGRVTQTLTILGSTSDALRLHVRDAPATP